MKTVRHLAFAVAGWMALAFAAAQVSAQVAPLRIICPTNQIIWTCGTGPVAVPYPAPAVSNNCRFPAQVSCVPPSGSLFTVGTSTVSCAATNDCGERDTCIFTVTVARDTTPPSIECPTNRLLRICGTNRVAVSWPAPTASDNSGGSVPVSCAPPSGSLFSVGNTVVTCTATDNCTNKSTCTFVVTVDGDATPPTIQCPTNIVAWTCSSVGTVVVYPNATASDNRDPNPTVSCSPASGSLFAPGTTIVTCVAQDDCTNRSSCTFSITVNVDTTPPVIQCPSNIIVSVCGTNRVPVSWPPPNVSDDHSRATVTCTPPSGSLFSMGSTLVTCTATDDCTNRITCTFTVTVNGDATPPTIECPEDIVVFTCNRNGTQVQYPAPAVNDDTDRSPTVSCTPPSGSIFPIGSTVVACDATDSCTNRSRCTFTVTVETDTTPPVIQCPTNIVAGTCNSNAVVNFPDPTAMDDQDGSPTVVCVPASGSAFQLGDTVVHCDAIDDCTNRSSCSFTVTVVTDTVPPFIDCPSDRTNVACSVSGVAVAFPLPEVSDNFDASVSRNCLPPSGSVFPVGTTQVTCTAEDDCNNRSQCSFNVTVVRDTTPPVLVCSNLVIETCSLLGGTTAYWPSATDDHDTHVIITCNPPHGEAHTFPIGVSIVNCEAVDNCTNRASCTFTVTVKGDTTLPGSDLDQNGLSDIWQIHFGTGALPPNEDPDGDGWTTAQEAVAGTDPQEHSGVWGLRIVFNPTEGSAGTIHVSWLAVAGKRYNIQSSPYLFGDGDYMDDDIPAGAPGPITVRFALDDPRYERLRSSAFFRFQVQDTDEDQDGLTAWEESIIGTSDRNPDTLRMPGGDRTYAEQWITQNGPAPTGKLREVTIAHLGGTPQGPTQTRLVTATGSGGFIQLSSWTVQPATHQPIHLQDTPTLEGYNAKLEVLEPPLSPALTINLFVHGRIRQDGNLWLTVYRLAANGAFTELSTVGYGANANVDILDFAVAHRPISNPSSVESFQLVTPVIASPEPYKQHLRLVTWSINPNTGALNGLFDSGDLNHSSVPGGGTGSIQARHQEGSAYVVSYATGGANLSSWFFEVPDAGFVVPRGGQTSGLDIRGATDVVVPAKQLALGTLTPDGFLTALMDDTCNIELMVWERRVTACDDGCFSRPFIITTNTADLLPGNGVQITPPIVTDSRDGTGEAGDHFGQVLAVGDFNGDGYQDVAIGTPGEDNGAGAVDVMYGSVAYLKGSNADDHFIQGSDGIFGVQEPGDAFGSALAVADFDGDGFDDLVIGIPGEDLDNNTIQAAGGVQILRGSIFGLFAPANNAFWSQDTTDIDGVAETGDNFGAALTVGDFNGDTHPDLAIGAPFEDIEAANAIAAGAIHIIYGSGNGLTTAGNFILHQDIFSIADDAESGDWFGRALAAGDFNADGRDDLVIGAPGESLGVLDGAGIVHILYGANNAFNVFTFMLSQNEFLPPGGDIQGSANFYDYFGWSLVTGDFNGDSYPDLAIGSPFDQENGAPFDSGVINVLFGGANGLVVAGNQLVSQDNMEGTPEGFDWFGYALATADFNGDARADLVAGARGEAVDDNTIPGAGAAHIIFGSGGGLTSQGDVVFWQGNGVSGAAESGDHFGAAVAAGDLNGDGLPDVVVGAPDEDEGDTVDTGAIHVLKGTEDGLVNQSIWTQGIQRKVRALLVDALDEQANGIGSGKLFEQMPANETTNVHAASVTKCMTLLLTVETLLDPASTISLDDIVTISQDAADTGGSFMGNEDGDDNDHPLLAGDKMPLRLLLYGMMIPSCNKSSRAIAEHLAGSMDAFVTNMNEKALALGMVNTHYSHPAHGGVTTPQDLVTLWLYAWQYPLFRQFASGNITYGDCGVDANMNQKCYFLQKTPYYPGIDGWKGGAVGWTVSGFPVPFCTSCLLGQATRLDRSMVVALQQSDNTGGDSARMFDYGYKVLFTPDYRGSAMLNTPNITDFAVRKVTDTLAVTAAIDAQNNLRVHTWQTVAGIGQVGLLNGASLTYNTLPVGTHYVPPTYLDMTRLPSIEAVGDYLTGRIQNGRIRLDIWRVAPEP